MRCLAWLELMLLAGCSDYLETDPTGKMDADTGIELRQAPTN